MFRLNMTGHVVFVKALVPTQTAVPAFGIFVPDCVCLTKGIKIFMVQICFIITWENWNHKSKGKNSYFVFALLLMVCFTRSGYGYDTFSCGKQFPESSSMVCCRFDNKLLVRLHVYIQYGGECLVCPVLHNHRYSKPNDHLF